MHVGSAINETDRIEKATATFRTERLCGRVSVAPFDGRRLPHVDHLVHLRLVTGGA
jgi:hypothetical protein